MVHIDISPETKAELNSIRGKLLTANPEQSYTYNSVVAWLISMYKQEGK